MQQAPLASWSGVEHPCRGHELHEPGEERKTESLPPAASSAGLWASWGPRPAVFKCEVPAGGRASTAGCPSSFPSPHPPKGLRRAPPYPELRDPGQPGPRGFYGQVEEERQSRPVGPEGPHWPPHVASVSCQDPRAKAPALPSPGLYPRVQVPTSWVVPAAESGHGEDRRGILTGGEGGGPHTGVYPDSTARKPLPSAEGPWECFPRTGPLCECFAGVIWPCLCDLRWTQEP